MGTVNITGGRGRGRGRVGRGISVDMNDQFGNATVGRGRGIQFASTNVSVRGRGRGRSQVVVDDFVEATSSNLPTVSCFTVAEYYQSLLSPELRQAKDQISASADYGDNAIGYVKLKRIQSICTVRASMTPQTSVNKSPYAVSVDVDESNKTISNATCTCQASAGSCKHHTALIFWLLRRSEEPSPTEVTCYWRKSILSRVKGIKSKSIDELSGRSTVMKKVDDDILKKFIELGKVTNKDAAVIRYSVENREKVTLYIDHLVISFLESHGRDKFNVRNFVTFCSQEMKVDRCRQVFFDTVEQSSKSEWYYQRFGRITASKLYESSRCSTEDGSLVASILGARKFKGNFATKRGQRLETEVFDLLKRKYPDIRKCGIILRPDMPIFGASPDGISDSYVFEIKCPTKLETVQDYVRDGVLQNKVYFQIQLQMLMCGKREGILCIADPKFEDNKRVDEYKVTLDESKLQPVLNDSKLFWTKVIFEHLK